jgi:hypothetical protein
MRSDALLKLLLVAVLLLLTIGVSRWSAITVRAAGSEPSVTAFYRGTSGGMRIMVFYPDNKKLFMYKDDGTCDDSWTFGATGGRLAEDKCK